MSTSKKGSRVSCSSDSRRLARLAWGMEDEVTLALDELHHVLVSQPRGGGQHIVIFRVTRPGRVEKVHSPDYTSIGCKRECNGDGF